MPRNPIVLVLAALLVSFALPSRTEALDVASAGKTIQPLAGKGQPSALQSPQDPARLWNAHYDGRRNWNRGHWNRGHWDGRRWYGPRYRTSRPGYRYFRRGWWYPFAWWNNPAIVYLPRRPYAQAPAAGGACAYWSDRCIANWGFNNPDYRGCMRYHRCY